MKITFMGAGSTVFARNVIGDCMCSEALRDSIFALYDIDAARLEESRTILEAMRSVLGGYGRIECWLGAENRRKALAGASFVVNAIQVGGYDPCTITDFEVPKKYGLRQTIADSWPNQMDDHCAREEWGWKPRFGLDEMVDDMIAELRKRFGTA